MLPRPVKLQLITFYPGGIMEVSKLPQSTVIGLPDYVLLRAVYLDWIPKDYVLLKYLQGTLWVFY